MVILATLKTERRQPSTRTPGHLVISPNGRYLQVSLNSLGDVVKVNLAIDRIVATLTAREEDRLLARR